MRYVLSEPHVQPDITGAWFAEYCVIDTRDGMRVSGWYCESTAAFLARARNRVYVRGLAASCRRAVRKSIAPEFRPHYRPGRCYTARTVRFPGFRWYARCESDDRDAWRKDRSRCPEVDQRCLSAKRAAKGL